MRKTIQLLAIIVAIFVGTGLKAQTCTAWAGNDQLICCTGGQVTLGGTPSGSTTCGSGLGYLQYSWSPGTGLNNANLPNPTASPNVTTTYTLCVVAYSGSSVACTATICSVCCDVVVVTVNGSCCRLKAVTPGASPNEPIEILIFPNPAKSNIVIETKKSNESLDLEILDSNGKVVGRSEIQPGINQTNTVDTSTLPRGLYFVKATTVSGPEVYSGKLVLE